MDLKEVQSEIDALAKKLGDPEFLSRAREAKAAGSKLQKLEKTRTILIRLAKIEEDLKESAKLKNDASLAALVEEEEERLKAEERKLKTDLEALTRGEEKILPADLIMEIRAGTGGEEAALFARSLFEMYRKFAESKKWSVEIISSSPSSLGGYKEIIFEINGADAYKLLKQESGVHRIQRIPETEKQGRIHTSTASVAVLPKVEDAGVEVRPQDVKIEFFRSSAPGGQNVNKVETAVRITHLPTGLVVSSQEGRSQLKNRERAMSLLAARLHEAKREAEERKISAERRSQIGSAERAEKIRTYNFPQDRITDHRINKSWHNIEGILGGNLEPIIRAFQVA